MNSHFLQNGVEFFQLHSFRWILFIFYRNVTAGARFTTGLVLGTFQNYLDPAAFLCHSFWILSVLSASAASLINQIFSPSFLNAFTTAYNPRLLMVRIPSEESFSVIHLSSSARKKRLCCRLGKNLRLVLILECETLFPETGRFPVTWHTLDIPSQFWTAKVGKNSGIGKNNVGMGMWKCENVEFENLQGLNIWFCKEEFFFPFSKLADNHIKLDIYLIYKKNTRYA